MEMERRSDLLRVFGTLEPGKNLIDEYSPNSNPTRPTRSVSAPSAQRQRRIRDSRIHPDSPYTTFTTKPVNKPSGTLAISDITLNTARISGTVQTNAPPGPLDAAAESGLPNRMGNHMPTFLSIRHPVVNRSCRR